MYSLRKLIIVVTVALSPLLGWSEIIWSQEPVIDAVKVAREPGPRLPKIEEALSERLLALRADETVAVGIWFTVPDYEGIQEMLLEKPRDEALRERISAALTERIARGNQPLIALLTDAGFEIDYASTKAPVIFANLNGDMIERLAQRDDVVAIYLSRLYVPAMEHAAKTERADVVWARGIDGSNSTKVAVVEVPEDGNPLGSRIKRPNHPYIPGANIAFRPGNPASHHATRVAGRIAAIHTPPDRWRGVAPGVDILLSANSVSGLDPDIIEASDWAIGQGARILNLSLEDRTNFSGVPDLLARYCDWVVYNHWKTVTTIAGNEGADANHVVTNPGLAYNTITVGAFEDQDDNRWWNPDDAMSPFSCFRDPPEANPPVGTDRELPEVVAVGQSVEAPDTTGGIGGPQDGTSFAAPAVAGVAALLLERKPLLAPNPEVVKAIIMAGACHNIEGDSRLSDSDGAGAVVACEADEIADNGNYHQKSLGDADFDGPAPTGNWNYNGMTLERSLKARVVICWLVPVGGAPNYNYPTGGPLTADLDLRVYDPSGTLVAASVSYDNNYEIVEFTPTQTGVHRIEVRRFTWTLGYVAFLGIAWTQDPCCKPDWGDAPDDMLHCPTRPERGDFPTKEISDGANVREFEVEWLSADNTTSPGATWEMDAYVDPFQNEQDEDNVSNIIPPWCIPNLDFEDDGVSPDIIYIAGQTGRVRFWVNSATPNIGRYSIERADEKIYVSGWFDWDHDDFTWVGNQEVHWYGGPGMVGVMDIGTCIKGCDMWDPAQHQKEVIAEFQVPWFLPVGPFWIRFRLDYGENISIETDTATYGEVEDHISYQTWKLVQDHDTPAYYWSGFSEGDALKKYFDPQVYFEEPVYPYKIYDVEFYLYDLAGVDSVDIRIDVEMVFNDSCGGPGTEIYVSDPITVSTFFPEMVHLPLPEPVCVWEPFFISLEYASGDEGSTPSFLFDSDVYPCDTCHAWVWHQGTGWYEWSDFWAPYAPPGCPIIRVAGFNECRDCMPYICGDVNVDSLVNSADVVYLINYLFKGGPPPEPECVGDVNCDDVMNSADVVYLINYLFKGDRPPCPECCILKAKVEEFPGQKTKRDFPQIRPVPQKLPKAPGDLKPIE